MVKKGIYLGGASNQNALFFEKYAPKNEPMPSLSRIDLPLKKKIIRGNHASFVNTELRQFIQEAD